MASRFNQSRQIKPLATEFTALAIACAIALVVVLAILFAYTAIASDDNLADSDASVPLTVKPANDVVDDVATGIVGRDTEQQLSILDPSLVPASFMQLLLEPGQDTLAIGQMLLAVWDNSMVPMALETLHFSYDPEVNEALYALLKLGTGENFGPDSDAWYRWWWRQPEIKHTYYSQFKASLYRVMDVKFSGYFNPQPRADIRLDEVRWGGVRQDGIPPLRQPKMISASDANYLDDDDVVFALEYNGDARAYPKRILAWHEMFVDDIGGDEYAGVYCTPVSYTHLTLPTKA